MMSAGDRKRCPGCDTWKTLDEFYRDRRRHDGRTHQCADCQRARAAKWYRGNLSRRRHSNLVTKYGLTLGGYERLLAEQGGVCAICDQASSVVLGVDHDHATGAVRGLLCDGCNIAVGLMLDDPRLLRAAAEYLERGDDHRVLRRLPLELELEGGS